ncbi:MULTISPECIES: hypothetical protein [Exiguobacterium]|uniref:hypothetical protein n=1 Tax=Exiguobacterium TaxID=33986 RepID=UPI0004A95DDE|nr:hypothetical protein [Exiguobacterium sp. AB2]KDN58527.1 hypothetical protein DI14_13235 [Exiguobacterium sp. AB2]
MDRQQVEYVERENAFLREQLQALTDQIEAVRQEVLEEGAKHIRGKENTIQKMKELEREVRQAKANADKWRKEAASEKAKRETTEAEVERLTQIIERAKAIPVAGKLVAKIEREGQSS